MRIQGGQREETFDCRKSRSIATIIVVPGVVVHVEEETSGDGRPLETLSLYIASYRLEEGSVSISYYDLV
jgi:hypothetical protein